jgi:hypothetical protein
MFVLELRRMVFSVSAFFRHLRGATCPPQLEERGRKAEATKLALVMTV